MTTIERLPRVPVLLVLASLLVSCGGEQPTQKINQKSVRQYAKVDDIGGVSLGMDFENVVSVIDPSAYDAYGLKECLEEVALHGCAIYGSVEKGSYARFDGIPYRLTYRFNTQAKLTDIGLDYIKERGIKRDECEQIHARTIDWLTAKYGPMASPVQSGTGVLIRRSPKGNAYPWSVFPDGAAISQPMRNVGTSMPERRRLPIVSWDGDRYISLLTSFIVVDGRSICRVSVEASEPERVERPAFKS